MSQPSGSPKNKLQWSPKPNILGACLPGAGPQGWVTQCGTQIPYFSAIVIILTFVGHPLAGMGLDHTATLPLLPHLVVVSPLYL